MTRANRIFLVKLAALPAVGFVFMVYAWAVMHNVRDYAESAADAETARAYVIVRLGELEKGPMIFSSILLFLCTLAAARAIMRRRANINALLKGVEELGEGNHSYRIPTGGDPELEALAATFDRAADAARRSSERLLEEGETARIAVATLGDGVIILGAEGEVRLANPLAKKIFGGRLASKGDLAEAARPYFDLETLLRAADAGPDAARTRVEMTVADRTFEAVATPIKDGERRAKGHALLLRDVTEQKLLGRVRQDFTAMLVHELRAPLINVRWTVETLREAPIEDEQVKERLDAVHDSAAGMLSIVNDILDVSKIEAGKFVIIPRIDDLTTLIDQKIAEFDAQAKAKGISVSRADVSVLPAFHFDRTRVGQALVNLLSNAVKFTDRGSVKVRASLDEHATAVRVSVEDTGKGMAPSQLPRLFKSFVQLGLAEEKDKKGTGLGLAIVKGIIEGHGGRVGAESVLGKGSVFWFELPLEPGNTGS